MDNASFFFFFCVSFVIFLGARLLFLGTGLGGRAQGSLQRAAMRGLRTGNGLYIISP